MFLLLRLLAATDRVDGWSSHSVDAVDVPAFFADYAGPALPVWLESLSQASNGDYEATAATAVAAYTDLASEALASHRLILANHAMLLAHLDELGGLGDDTLLIVDEAHQLEDAATSALTTTLDYRAVEDLFAELVGGSMRTAAWPSGQRSPMRCATSAPCSTTSSCRRSPARRSTRAQLASASSSDPAPSPSPAPTPAPPACRRCARWPPC